MSRPKVSAKREDAKASPSLPAPPDGRSPSASASAKHLKPGQEPEGRVRPELDGATGSQTTRPRHDDECRVDIPEAGFEGPLDLLLHLIQQHEIDILDIPISFVTERFLAYLAVMRSLTIDVASEYLVMAATLAHIKSKMLLPTLPADQDDGLPDDEDEDPRAELVRRLLEYQKYKAAAVELAERGTLGRDVFGRGSREAVPQGPAPFASLGVFSLLDAFEKVLARTKVRIDHEVIFDRISITDRILELSEKLASRRTARFEELIAEPGKTPSRFDLVITFLAILEMAKLRMIRLYQSDPLAPIHLELATPRGESEESVDPPGEAEA